MNSDWLAGLPHRRAQGSGEGITSICSAHPSVIAAALAAAGHTPALIEATCNQVNHEGGYTGMTPADFRRMVEDIARTVGYDPTRLVLGGDHLGPNPWRTLDAETALGKAEAMVAAYVAAGFAKIHLDPSMGCRGEPAALGDALVAERAARLAVVAEQSAREADLPPPVYVVGTEVPAPGGASHALATVEVTRPEAVRATLAAQQAAFAARGLGEAFARVIALVVQPGVEFSDDAVVAYVPEKAKALSEVLREVPGIVFEAHSTDYQPPDKLAALVRDGFAILKVGPALTFALREALYALDRIAAELDPDWPTQSLEAVMERQMVAEPGHWHRYYLGSEGQRRILRHYSYSDRIRYYWPHAEARAAVGRLLAALAPAPLPETSHQPVPARRLRRRA